MVESEDKDTNSWKNKMGDEIENVKYIMKEHVPSLIIVIGSVVLSTYITWKLMIG